MSDGFKYKVTLPGYEKPFVVSSGTELNQQQAYEYARQQADKLVSVKPTPEVSTMRGLAQQVTRGATFGSGEELTAGLMTGGFSGPEYQRERDILRGEAAQFQQESPISSALANITGAIGAPLALFKALPRAAQVALSPTTLPKQIATGALTGTATGALTGAGEAPEMADVPTYAGMTALAGGVTGTGAPVVIQGGGRIIRNVLNSFGIGNTEKISNRMLAEALQKDNLTTAEAGQVLQELRNIGVPNVALADIGQSLKDLAYRAYVVPSTAKGATKEFLSNRLVDQPNDIVKGIAQKAGLNPNVTGYEYLSSLADAQKTAAQAAYPKAYSLDVSAVPFRKYVDRDVFQKAYQEAQKRADVYGESLPSIESIRNSQFVPTDVLHQMKIGLDRVIEGETDKVTGKVTAFGRDVSIVKRQFNDEIKTLNPQYAKANQEFADFEGINKAFQTGQKYQKLDPIEALDKLKTFNPAQKESFRLGMMADINNRASEFKGGDFTRQVFMNQKQKSLLRYAFDDPKQYDEFVKYIDGLKSQTQTAKRIIGTVPTAENLATIGGEGAADLLTSAATGGKSAVLMNLLRQIGPRTRGIGEQTSAELQKKLFSVDPMEQRAIMQELQKRMQAQRNLTLPSGVAVGNITGLLGNQ